MNRTPRWFRAKGMHVKCLMTDDGRGYVSRLFAKTCRVLDNRHIRIRTIPQRRTERSSTSPKPCSGNGPTPCLITAHTDESLTSSVGAATTRSW